MNSDAKKRPEDYPQFAFRVKAADKLQLMKRIDSLLKARKASVAGGKFTPKKNEIIVRALELGIGILEKSEMRRRKAAPKK